MITPALYAVVQCACAYSADVRVPESSVSEVRQRLKANDAFGAYVAAKTLAAVLAENIARERIELLVTAYAVKDKGYQQTRQYAELALVAPDAWDVLAQEWHAASSDPERPQDKAKRAVLMSIWIWTYELRALELVAEYALAGKDRDPDYLAPAGTVEALAGVSFGMRSEMTQEQIQAYWKRLGSWWQKHRPLWRHKITRKEETLKLLWKQSAAKR